MFIIFLKGDFFISKNNFCPVCGDIVTNPNKTYCDSCTSRFNTYERKALVGINKGKYKKSLANKMLRLRKEGKSNAAIAREVKLPDPYVNSALVVPLIRFLLNDEASDVLESYKKHKLNNKLSKKANFDGPNQNHDKKCPICGKKVPVSSNSKYCNKCNSKYTFWQRVALEGINNGTYTKDLAMEIKVLMEMGYSKNQIADELNLPNNFVIKPIMEYLYNEQDSINSSLININDLESLDLNRYLIRTDNGNKSNILLKGNISGENRSSLFNCLSGNGISVKEISLKENSNNGFDVAIDLDVDEDYVDSLIFELKLIGFE